MFGCLTPKLYEKRKPGLTPVPAFPGVDIELFVVKVHLFGGVVAHTTFTHEPADVLNRGPAIHAGTHEPAFRVDFDNQGLVAYQLNRAVVEKVFMSLGIVVSCDGSAVQITCHCFILLSFISCPFGQVYINIPFYICQDMFLGV